MKHFFYIALFFALAVDVHAQTEEDSIIVPPTKIIISTDAISYAPNFAYNFGKANAGFEFYAGRDISIGVSGGAFFVYRFSSLPFRHLVMPNTAMTNAFGTFFQIDLKRFFGNKTRVPSTFLAFPLAQLQYKNTKAENTGYYVGFRLSQETFDLFYDVYDGSKVVKKSEELFNVSINLTIGYQSISSKGWAIDQSLGIGIVKGKFLTQNIIEYNLFKNIQTDFYPNISYSLKFGKEFIREFRVKER
jgi:hypothetical protein